ncbi:MAG: EAL domain-containing protein [Agathobacter sp.]|uniref:EAL domain-containing protein n=1 Tax=Agathobacter sp. TaxID=2021311 RepID=UPI002E786406|nr:EAL domain-containing protein [Agathobacter sp.]MEE1218176.1 EAL domain-containing protein [Agathobacter sp.]
MRIVYGLTVLLEAMLIAHCAIGSFKKHDKIGKSVCMYESLALACAIVFFIFTFVPGYTVTVLAKGLTMALFDWMLIALMLYTQYYTGAVKSFKSVQAASIIFAVLDTYMLIENTWTNKIFGIESIKAEHINVVFNQDSLWYKLHFMFTYAFAIMIIFTYLFMFIRSSRLYKQAYGAIAAVIIIGVSFDVATIGSDSIYDLSMIIYGVMSVIIYYLTYRYVPNELIENMLSLVVSDMNNGIICYDRKGRCIYYNDLVEAIYHNGGNMSEYERKYSRWIEKTGDDRRDSMTFQTDIELNGEKHYFEIAYKRIYDERKRFICDYFVYNDRTQMYESWEQEKYKASHDSLTGLLNRDQFYEDVHDMVNKYHDTTFYLICSNIKDFKFINEIFGMEKGNQVLIKQAKLMASNPSERTICARLMNDRFALCLPREEFDEKRVADSIKELQREFSGNSFHLHTYMGVYEIRDRDEAVRVMVDKANIAADTIKNDFDCCVAYYDEHLLEISIEQRRLLGEFEPALQKDEFVMYLQPQVNRDGIAKGAEALVRWAHPSRGILTPYAFIDILENAGLIYKLDLYIWEKAAQKLAEWKEKGYGSYHISVNISTKDFYIIDIYETFTGLISKYDIPASKLHLEITETTLMTDFEKNMNIIHKLQDAGFRVEIDDFGSGYSSLNMLKDISADVLKIDMGFLRESENEVKGQDILESIITLASKIGMDVITEGVETKKQLDMLTMMGCHEFQGYYFSKPVPVSEFEEKYLV